jgi:hypothetical protein
MKRLNWAVIWLFIALVCCVLEGAVRKWVVGDKSWMANLAYFSKDIAFTAAMVAAPRMPNRLALASYPWFIGGLLLSILGAMLSTLSGFSPLGAILSFRVFFLLPLVAWQAGQVLPPDTIRRVARWLAWLAIPMAILGVIQFFSPSGSFINRYSTGEEIATTGFSERIRATGTFSYISGLYVFANYAVWAGIVAITLADTKRQRQIGALGLIAGIACTLVTVSRSTMLISVAVLAAWLFLGGKALANLKPVALIIAVAGVGLYMSGYLEQANEVVSAVQTRSLRATDNFAERLIVEFSPIYDAFVLAPLGNGFGSEQAGRGGTVRVGSTYESPWGRLVMELGIVGLMGFVVSMGIAAIPIYRLLTAQRRGRLRTTAGVTAVVLLTNFLIGFQFNHVASFFFWFLTAALLALGNEDPAALAGGKQSELRSAA